MLTVPVFVKMTPPITFDAVSTTVTGNVRIAVLRLN
jgi:hypothetical protein